MTRKSGSEGGGEETTGRGGRHRRLAADPAALSAAVDDRFARRDVAERTIELDTMEVRPPLWRI